MDTIHAFDAHFMDMSHEVSKASTCNGIKVGAVVVKGFTVLSEGYNHVLPGNTPCNEQGFCYAGFRSCIDEGCPPSRSIHAEIDAISNAHFNKKNIHDSTIYITHQPCASCLKAIMSFGIKRVVYTFNDAVQPSQQSQQFLAEINGIELVSISRSPKLPYHDAALELL